MARTPVPDMGLRLPEAGSPAGGPIIMPSVEQRSSITRLWPLSFSGSHRRRALASSRLGPRRRQGRIDRVDRADDGIAPCKHAVSTSRATRIFLFVLT